MTLEDRFRAKFEEGDPWDCWEWQACRTKDGYGRIGIGKGKVDKAHRVAFELFHGRPVEQGLEVMHLCDNPSCVNPCHLKEGTHYQNMMDSINKGRLKPPPQTPEAQAKQRQNTLRGERSWMKSNGWRFAGERNGNSKLTASDVREIRRLRSEGMTIVKIAQQFGVTHGLISQICLGRIWALSPEGGGT